MKIIAGLRALPGRAAHAAGPTRSSSACAATSGRDRAGRARPPRPRAALALFTIAYTATEPGGRRAGHATRSPSLYMRGERPPAREAGRRRHASSWRASSARSATRWQDQEQRITDYKEQHLGELPEQREVNLRTLERLQQQLSLAHENNRRASERRQLLTQSLDEIDLDTAHRSGGGSDAGADDRARRRRRPRGCRSCNPAGAGRAADAYSDKYPDVDRRCKEQIRHPRGRGGRRGGAAGRGAGGSPEAGRRRRAKKPARDLRLAVAEPLRAEPDAAARPGRRRGEDDRRRDHRRQPPDRRLPEAPGEHAEARAGAGPRSRATTRRRASMLPHRCSASGARRTSPPSSSSARRARRSA